MQKEDKTGSFSNLGIGENFLSIITQKGFKIPTPIQRQIIPGALEGKDVVGIAQTGTGKTLAFGIPIIQRLSDSKGQGLILVPTRELALQVEAELRQVGASLGLRSAVIIGGTSQYPQVKALKRDPHVVIATPGRLADLMKQGLYSLKRLSIITLDEADRMLDDGFLPEIKRILKMAPKEHQTMLFSATMPKSISSLASEFMKMPLRIEITPQGTSSENTDQEVFVVRKNNKMRLLDNLLQKYSNDTILLFSRTKYGAKRIARDIRSMKHTATEIHSNRSQAQRKAALDGFKRGKFRILVATDIAARGIDVKNIGLVINFDLPDNSEDYVHRIGRTGRAGSHGKAISFVTPSQKADVKKIERLIRKSLPVLSLPDLPPERVKPPYQERERPRYSKSKKFSKSNYNSRGNNRKRKSNNSKNKKKFAIGHRSAGGYKKR
jgi:ATP-dependent RNA helicase RhlE